MNTLRFINIACLFYMLIFSFTFAQKVNVSSDGIRNPYPGEEKIWSMMKEANTHARKGEYKKALKIYNEVIENHSIAKISQYYDDFGDLGENYGVYATREKRLSECAVNDKKGRYWKNLDEATQKSIEIFQDIKKSNIEQNLWCATTYGVIESEYWTDTPKKAAMWLSNKGDKFIFNKKIPNGILLNHESPNSKGQLKVEFKHYDKIGWVVAVLTFGVQGEFN